MTTTAASSQFLHRMTAEASLLEALSAAFDAAVQKMSKQQLALALTSRVAAKV